jgi:hypothetical protein
MTGEKSPSRTVIYCPHGDPSCPCPDGLECHYEGPDAWPSPVQNDHSQQGADDG